MRNTAAVLLLLSACSLAAAPALAAEPASAAAGLVGTWVSTEPILMNLKFSLTFTDTGYEVDCTLGQTTGVYTASDAQIFFTPLKVGINSGDVGKSDTWTYRFWNPDSFQLTSGPVSVRLYRRTAGAPAGTPGG
ncbi:MAG TPA: hypothetical protein VFI08_11815 [Spirochaetia bacterium]|nr:hypothetical protein [Spirochaetia bacterium]